MPELWEQCPRCESKRVRKSEIFKGIYLGGMIGIVSGFLLYPPAFFFGIIASIIGFICCVIRNRFDYINKVSKVFAVISVLMMVSVFNLITILIFLWCMFQMVFSGIYQKKNFSGSYLVCKDCGNVWVCENEQLDLVNEN